MNKWVVCLSNSGYLFDNGVKEDLQTSFDENSIGLIKEELELDYLVWLIGNDKLWLIPKAIAKEIDVTKTGDKFETKICNVCHCLKPTDQFARNQNNKHGIVRRPSCMRCRTDIDKRAPKTKQAKEMEKTKPNKGDPFCCPICRKRSIAGVTAKIVADHDHHTGNIRAFICDSCNTGLGRFKNGNNYLLNAVQYIKKHDKLS
ncbi:MAG: endonuclease VII domain-containing protein [Holophagaceae bacterium]|nr:endonuclease VII domain-containing protein [Holophagaceae bacterium]